MENPLLKALPPETDYLSYLTILEYNLSLEQLPTLHQVLQDTTLTANIGWDLVHLLLPFLPDSRLCLQDVARLGNPREVVLKVTELLEQLGTPPEDPAENEGDDEAEGDDSGLQVSQTLKEGHATTERAEDGRSSRGLGDNEPAPNKSQTYSDSPSKVLQFATLLSMLQTLHPRIKTKYPSRFLSTSLQAILPAYASVAYDPEATEAIVALIKALSGTSRPKLPPRINSTSVLTQEHNEPESAPDPEGNDGSIGSEEAELQTRLLQSFLTHAIEAYVESLPITEDIPGMAWSSRLQEKLHPEKNIPGRRTYSEMFSLSDLHQRDTIIGQLAALARDLKLTTEDILATIIEPENDPSSPAEDFPTSASDVPLSRHGSLYLFCATAAASTLFDAPSSIPSLAIFQHFSSLLPSFIGVSSPSSAGSEPPCLIDAILFLGTYIISTSSIGTPETDETFNETLQRLSLLSANTPSPTLRYHAHLLTAKILHSHPNEELRLAYIKDTLEHCPYENLKASALAWLKTDLLAAANEEPSETHREDLETKREPSLFATPVALSVLSPHLFTIPRIPEDLSPEEMSSTFSNHQPLWLAVLNLIYLILSSPSLSQRLGTEEFVHQSTTYVDNLEEVTSSVVAARTKEEVEGLEYGREGGEVGLLQGLLRMVRDEMS